MNVLHTIYHAQVGGSETHLKELLSHLNESEYKCVVITFTKGYFYDTLKEMGIKCYLMPSHRKFDFSLWKQIREIAIRENIDIINAHGTKACSNSFWAAKSLDIPLVYTAQNWAFHPCQNRITRTYKILQERFLVHQANLNISVSVHQEKLGRKLLKLPNSRIIPHGVDTIKFNHRTRGKLSKSELGIPRNRTLVGLISRLCHQKDPITLLKGFRQALNTDHNLHLLIVGEGSLKNNCLDAINDLKLEAHVTYIPFVENVIDALSIIDIYCLPSLWEDLPIGMLEAMALKKPVIATPVDGITEVIADKVNGLLVNPCCENDWKEAILKLHHSPELRKQFADRARLIVEAHHDIESTAQKMQNVYQDIYKSHKPDPQSTLPPTGSFARVSMAE